MSQFVVPESQRSLFGGRPTRAPRAENAGPLQAAQRTLKYFRDRGWFAEVTERWVEIKGGEAKKEFKGGYRKDLFGFCDVLCFRSDQLVMNGKAVNLLAVQTTSRQQITNHLLMYRDVGTYVRLGLPEQADQKRKQHAALLERLRAWVDAPGCGFLIQGWEPVSVPKKSGGGHKVVWTVTDRFVTADDFQEARF